MSFAVTLDMSVKKLSEEIQSIICSSINITNYKRTVEELVYNSLDAKSKSIAIRIHVQDNKIQVVDNGCGISKKDFKILGQRYSTSKCVDLATFKSAPNSYGFRGQALSSIIEVSKYVRITSRIENTEETWSKAFYAGKEQTIIETNTRPSKGTTVEICGFLYNLKIQNKSINALQEINEIKTFLEQLSLVHNNLSLTLRDDSTNEIVFKMHKNRDIYQKIQNLFDIDQSDIQELQVEKNEYKCVGYIGKKCDEITSHHWIYLNNKIIKNGKLKKLVQHYFIKYLKLSNKVKKCKSNFAAENDPLKKYVPFYIIFLSCPHSDYDISVTPKQSILEFKNWKQITILLEKLVKFYKGDLTLKESKIQEKPKILEEKDIREQVREITRKFLGSNSKKLGLSQMQKGIKGKLIKRKKNKPQKVFITKVLPSREPTMKYMDKISLPKLSNQKASKYRPEKRSHRPKLNKACDVDNNDHLIKLQNNYETDLRLVKIHNEKLTEEANFVATKKSKLKDVVIKKKAKKRNRDYIFKVFENPTDTVKRRCDVIVKEAEAILNQRRKQTVTINETVNYSNIVKDNKNISIRKRVGEIIIHDVIPLQKNHSNKRHNKNALKNTFVSSYDLLNTILNSQRKPSHSPINDKDRYNQNRTKFQSFKNDKVIPRPTYQSHNYNNTRDEVMSHHYCLRNNGVHTGEIPITQISVSLNCNKYNNKIHFISKQSRENFALPKPFNFNMPLKRNKTDNSGKSRINFNNYHEDLNISDIKSYTRELSYTINQANNRSCIETNIFMDVDNPLSHEKHNHDEINVNEHIFYNNDVRYSRNSSNFGFTYTITSSNILMNVDDHHYRNYEFSTRDDNFKMNFPFKFVNSKCKNNSKQNHKNINFVSESQNSLDDNNGSSDLQPIEVCEAIVNTADSFNQSQLQFNYNYSICNDSSNCFTQVNHESSGNNITRVPLESQVPSNNYLLNNFNDNTEISATFGQESRTDDPKVNSKDVNDDNLENNEDNDHSSENNYCDERNLQKYKDPFSRQVQRVSIDSNDNTDINAILDQEDETHNVRKDTKHINDDVNYKDDEKDDYTHITESNYFNDQILENNQKLHTDVFKMKNRARFVPKGMSPIFENCNSKNVCDYNIDKEYFERSIYHNFNNDVQTNTKIYEATVQNAKKETTKDIEKFNFRLEQDNSILTFNSESLKRAEILKQVDNKFIAAVINKDSDIKKYVVLFDQHAVHERIRLEENLDDYFNGNEWKSVNLDGVSLKMTKEDIMYLHNYKDKFNQFGLQWTVVDSQEIKIHAIPFAILGRNPREVDKVMKIVKNLISEEISNIKSQKGCVSVYPKSIMDLVNNEACRYAIMFGDALSKSQCIELIQSLSNCKTPFQCAHGRPVMAVVMEFKPESCKYQVDLKNVLQFKDK